MLYTFPLLLVGALPSGIDAFVFTTRREWQHDTRWKRSLPIPNLGRGKGLVSPLLSGVDDINFANPSGTSRLSGVIASQSVLRRATSNNFEQTIYLKYQSEVLLLLKVKTQEFNKV